MFDDIKDFNPLYHQRRALQDVFGGALAAPFLGTLLIGIIVGGSPWLAFVPAIFAALTVVVILARDALKPQGAALVATFSVWNTLTTFWAFIATTPKFDPLHALTALAVIGLVALLARFWAGRMYDKAQDIVNERIRKAKANGTYRDPFADMFGGGFGTYGPSGGRAHQQRPFGTGATGYRMFTDEEIRRARAQAAAQQSAGQMALAYQTLGVPNGADQATVKTAYRKLAAKHHPDHAGPAGTATMAKVNAAKDLIYTANGWK
jgi:hypothetical protein